MCTDTDTERLYIYTDSSWSWVTNSQLEITVKCMHACIGCILNRSKPCSQCWMAYDSYSYLHALLLVGIYSWTESFHTYSTGSTYLHKTQSSESQSWESAGWPCNRRIKQFQKAKGPLLSNLKWTNLSLLLSAGKCMILIDVQRLSESVWITLRVHTEASYFNTLRSGWPVPVSRIRDFWFKFS